MPACRCSLLDICFRVREGTEPAVSTPSAAMGIPTILAHCSRNAARLSSTGTSCSRPPRLTYAVPRYMLRCPITTRKSAGDACNTPERCSGRILGASGGLGVLATDTSVLESPSPASMAAGPCRPLRRSAPVGGVGCMSSFRADYLLDIDVAAAVATAASCLQERIAYSWRDMMRLSG